MSLIAERTLTTQQLSRSKADVPIETASSFLSLPKLGDAAVTYACDTDPGFLTFGKLMLNSGITMENDPKKDLLKIMQDGLKNHLQNHCNDDIEHALMTVTVQDGNGIHITAFSTMDAAPSYFVKEKIDAIRHISPPLAWYFWNTMDLVASVVPILTPSWFMAMVSHFEWMDGDNEQDYIEEMLADGVPEDEINVIRCKDVEREAVPPWAQRACAAKNASRIRRRIHVDETYVPFLAELDRFREMAQHIKRNPAFANYQTGYHHFAIMPVLDDKEHGLWYQVMDDIYRYVMESGNDEEEYLFQLVINFAENNPVIEEHWLDLLRAVVSLWSSINQFFLTYFGD